MDGQRQKHAQVAYSIFREQWKDMGKDTVPVQYGRLQFIFQGQQPITDQLAALCQGRRLAAAILARVRNKTPVKRRRGWLKLQIYASDIVEQE